MDAVPPFSPESHVQSPQVSPVKLPEKTHQDLPPASTFKPRKGRPEIAAIFVFTIIIFFVGIFVVFARNKLNFGTNKQVEQVLENMDTVVPTEAPLPEQGVTPTRKVYTNTGRRFEMTFPHNWTGPINVSGDDEAGQVSYEGPHGSITLVWAGGSGGEPCTEEKRIINTGMGELGLCLTHLTEGTELRNANDGPTPKAMEYMIVNALVKTDLPDNEQIVLQTIATLKAI